MIKQNVCLNENSCHAVGVRYLESGKSSVGWVSFSEPLFEGITMDDRKMINALLVYYRYSHFWLVFCHRHHFYWK